MKKLSSLLNGFSRSRAITLLGLVVVVISTLDPAIFEGHPYARVVALTIGAVAAALGRALLHPSKKVFDRRFYGLAFMFVPVLALTIVTTGCPKVSREDAGKPDVRAQIVQKMRNTANALDATAIGIEEAANTFHDLDAAQAIKPETARAATRHLLKANRIGEEGTSRFLKVQNMDEAERGNIASLIGEFTGALDSLLSDQIIQIKNPKTQLYVFMSLRSGKVGLTFLQADLERRFADGVSIPVDEETKRILARAEKRYKRVTQRLREDLQRLDPTAPELREEGSTSPQQQ